MWITRWINGHHDVEIVGITLKNTGFIGKMTWNQYQRINKHKSERKQKICKLFPLMHIRYPQNVDIILTPGDGVRGSKFKI